METLIVASIETLKRNIKKFGKEEVLHLVQELAESEVTKQHFELFAFTERSLVFKESQAI